MAPFCSCPASLVSGKFFAVGPGCAKCFFLLRSVGRRDLSAGPEQKKKHPGWSCFLLWPGWCFFCSGPAERSRRPTERNKKTHFAHPGPTAKNFLETNDAGRADAHSLTAGLGGDASPSPGWFFFFCCGPARTGGVFFAVAPPGRSLTHCGLGRFRQGPGGVFFCCGPAGSF